MLAPYKSARVSSLSKISDRIYFKFYPDEAMDGRYKLGDLTKERNVRQIQFSLTKDERKVYETRWRNGLYDLKFDEARNLYYVESANRGY